MELCNCHQDLNALLIDIPKEWREGIVNALCSIVGTTEVSCTAITSCETNTSLSPFTLIGSNLSIIYKNELGQIKKKSVDLSEAFNNALDGIDPLCLTDQTTWDGMTHSERIELLGAAICDCCPVTTTTTTTTTSTSTTTTTTAVPECVLVRVTTTGTEGEVNYTDCNGDPQTESFEDEVAEFCIQNFSIGIVSGDPIIEIIDVCTDGTTSTSTTTSSTTTTTTLAPNLFWIPFATECESGNGFEVDKVITGLSSPARTWYDTTNELVYVADHDSPSGNVYWFDPVTATTESDMTYSVAIAQSELYNTEIDSQYRRIYFVGRNSGGLLVYDIDTNTTSVVAFGTNGIAFQRIQLLVTANRIYCYDKSVSSGSFIIIDRATLNILSTIPKSSIPNNTRFNIGGFTIFEVGSEIWVCAGSGSSVSSIGVYNQNLTTNITNIVLAGAATWDFARYWQIPFWDSLFNRVYISEIGSSSRIVINPTTYTVIDTRVENNKLGKSNCQTNWSINPITNELVASFAALNSSVDASPIGRIYITNRTTYDYINMFENQYYTNLVAITGTNNLMGNDTGATFWSGAPDYDTDGSISILSSSIGVDNNGTLLVISLQEIDGNNGNTPTGNYKTNIVGDPDYIPPYFNSSNCPIIQNLNCPTSAMTTFDTGTLYYEFSIPASVKNNVLIDNIAVYAYNTDTVSREGSPIVIPDITVSNYYSGSFSSLAGSNYTIEIVYRDSINSELENCFVS